jgi:hypothetical protein
MYAGRNVMSQIPLLAALAQRQSGVLTRDQLAGLGIDNKAIAAHRAAGRWSTFGPVIVVTHQGPLSLAAQRWAATLNSGPSAGLCAWTALAQWGLRGWDRDLVHVVVPRGATPYPLRWVQVHESRRHAAEDLIRPGRQPPAHSVARAAVDAGAWDRSSRTACGLLAATVQQHLTGPDELYLALDAAGRVRHRKVMAATVRDVQGGADALSEIDLGALCARAGLPAPTRQSVRLDARGRRRYRDVEWRRWDGRLVVGEIDGMGHLEVTRWYDDLLRDAELAVVEDGALRFRLPALALRTDEDRVVRILQPLLLPQPRVVSRSGC